MRQRVTFGITVEMDGDEWLGLEPASAVRERQREVNRTAFETFMRTHISQFANGTLVALEASYAEPGGETLACGCSTQGWSIFVGCDEGRRLNAAVEAVDAPYYAALGGEGPDTSEQDIVRLRLASGLAYGALEAHFRTEAPTS